MKITENTVVTLHFRLFNQANKKELDHSYNDEPIQLLIGQNSICKGLDQALLNKQAGDQFRIELDAESAFGQHEEDNIQTLPMTVFEEIKDLDVGIELIADTDQGPKPIKITHIEDGYVTIDANHSLAGLDVAFDINILDVRACEPSEIEHGYIH